jgi:hypothetical protein
MGEMKLTLGLSGWTSNDWTRGSAIDLVAPPRRPTPEQIERVGAYLKSKRIAKPGEIERFCMLDGADSAATLRHLAQAGQAIADLPGGVFRWRQIMPQALGEAEIGPEHAELAGARQIMASKPVKVESREEGPNGSVILAGKVDGTPVEVLLDAERNTKRGKCVCGYYRKFSLRNGPCRHMIVLRRLLEQQTRPSVGTWDQRMKGWMM